MTFLFPEAFGLVPLVLLAGWVLWTALRWKERTMALLARSSSPMVEERSASRKLQLLKGSLLVLALGLLVIALARPNLGQSVAPQQAADADIVVALDVSQSMAAEDVAPSRLALAKAETNNLLERLRGERIGLVVFAGTATLRFPLTQDYEAAATLLRSVEVDSAPTPGSSVADGVRAATRALQQRDAAVRAILLLSDGEAWSGDLQSAAQDAAQAGIVVHAIGTGTTTGSTIPVRTPGSTAVQPKRDRSGQIIQTRLEEEGLQQVAAATGGTYRRAGSGARELQQIYESSIQRRAESTAPPSQPSDLTPYFALGAFLVLLIELLLSERRRGARLRPLITGLLPLLLLPGCIPSAESQAFQLNEHGLERYKGGYYTDALESFRRASIQQPDLPELNFNTGDALYQTGEYERGVRETQKALTAEDPQFRSAAHFNMGNGYFQLNRFQDAYEEYKQALRENPDDLDAKVNLELALEKLREPSQQPPGQGQQQQQTQSGQDGDTGNQGSQPQQSSQQQPQPAQGQSGPGSQQGTPSGADAEQALRRLLQQAGPDFNIEDALRMLDILRDREAQLQGRYQQGPPDRRPGAAQRPEKDW